MASNYVSRYTGEQIDGAVSYYLGFGASRNKQEILIGIEETDWKDIDNGEGGIYFGKYYILINLTGLSQIGGDPIVFFTDENGNKWELDHTFGSATSPERLMCYSNLKISGNIHIISPFATITDPAQVAGTNLGEISILPSDTSREYLGDYYVVGSGGITGEWANCTESTNAPAGSYLYVVAMEESGAARYCYVPAPAQTNS